MHVTGANPNEHGRLYFQRAFARGAVASQGPKLTACPPVELIEWSFEGRVTDVGDDEDVGLDVPRLVGDDTKLHGRGILRVSGRPRSPAAAISGMVRGIVARVYRPADGAGDANEPPSGPRAR